LLTGELYRRFKYNGRSPCSNCHTAKIPCQYLIPKKRGPKTAQCQNFHLQEPLGLTSPAPHSPTGLPDSPTPPGTTASSSSQAYSYSASDSRPFNTIVANVLSTPPESQTQAAARVHLDLLAGLLVADPLDTPALMANYCILLYAQHVFGTVPMYYKAALRATVNRFFFISPSVRRDNGDINNETLECFAADNEWERVKIFRNLTLLTALYAVIIYIRPESLLPNKHLTVPLFLQTSRETLKIYEDYNLKCPNWSSLSIHLFLSSAI
jgi:hypothetical protein